MDIQHIALAATRKFDGERLRQLDRAEIAQIAGRAGRYTADGTFGVTGRVPGLDEDVVEAIENNIFPPLAALCWRSRELDFSAPGRLLASLDRASGSPALVRGRPADDYLTLAGLARREEVMARASGARAVEVLWDVCQIPDFRKTLSDSHQELAAGVYVHLMDGGRIPESEVSGQIRRLDRVDGDVDTLMARIAHIRTWTYITHKTEWITDAAGWQDEARAIEDKLSDALHEALTRRFVDRRAAVLMRAVEEGGGLLAGIKASGEVVVEGQEVGILEGFRFHAAPSGGGPEHKAIMAAARSALRPEIKRRIYTMLDAQDKQFQLADDGEILFQPDASNPLPGRMVARVKKGAALLKPAAALEDSDLLEGKDREAVAAKVQEWLDRHIATVLDPLPALADEEGIEGAARGIAFQVHEALGILPRAQLEDLIKDLDEAGRAALRARKVRLGPVLVFLPALNKPAAVRLRALLWNLWHGKELPAEVPPNGMTSFPIAGREIDAHYLRAIGYPVYGNRAIRVDMLDRLICAVYDSAKDGQFRAQHKMAEWLGCPIPDLYLVLEAMGHTRIEEKKAEEAGTESAVAPAVETEEAAPAAEEVTAAPEAQPAPVAENTEAVPAAAEETQAAPAAEEPPVSAGAAETPAEVPAETPAPAAKPELALFRLRRGKAYGAPRGARPAKFRKKQEGERPGHKGGERAKGRPPQEGGHRRKDKERPRRDHGPGRGRDRDENRGADRVAASAAPKELAASPFAMLKNMKVKSGE
jgi:ATP-dependent RNA helicase SUPV3L1/SUV3